MGSVALLVGLLAVKGEAKGCAAVKVNVINTVTYQLVLVDMQGW